jgi:hypothetical protein
MWPGRRHERNAMEDQMTFRSSAVVWAILQSQAPPTVIEILVKKKMWSREDGPMEKLDVLARQLAPYFGFYPDSETLRAEFQAEFETLSEMERDGLFRLIKSLKMGRPSLYVGPQPSRSS